MSIRIYDENNDRSCDGDRCFSEPGPGRMLNRALGEEKIPIFFSEKKPDHDIGKIIADQRAEEAKSMVNPFRTEPAIEPYRGQTIPGSWFLADKETLLEILQLLHEGLHVYEARSTDHRQRSLSIQIKINNLLK